MERIDFYLLAVVTFMFLAGCFLMVASARERAEERRRMGLNDCKDRGRPRKVKS
jgi:hypothetical protein